MATVLATELYEFTVYGQCDTQNIFSRFYYTSEVDQTTTEALTKFRTKWQTTMCPLFATNYRASRYILRTYGTTVTDAQGERRIFPRLWVPLDGDATADNGTRAGDPTPPHIAAVCSSYTGRATYAIFSSVRVSPLVEAVHNNGILTPAFVAEVNTAFGLMSTVTMVDGKLDRVVWARRETLKEPAGVSARAYAFKTQYNTTADATTRLRTRQKPSRTLY